MLKQSHQVSKFSKKLKKEERLNKSLWFGKKLKKNEEILQEIKEKPKDSDGVTYDIHIELNVFPCTASEKRKDIGSENTKEPVLSITKSDSKTGVIS